MCIKFDMKIILFFVIFYITNKWQTYLLVMLFIFMHEMTHLVVGKMLGVNPLMVEIKSTGCSISFEYKLKDYNKKLLKSLFYIKRPVEMVHFEHNLLPKVNYPHRHHRLICFLVLTFKEFHAVRLHFSASAEVKVLSGNEIYGFSASCIEMSRIFVLVDVD